ncbi:MAG: mechanosensitive ion channel [Candidatus Marinimicrobia bacterium]|nr:mechanosensitive ion channel [Candidatus Neomarinimicrobiota bacterium]MCF7828331.1 mechanosensitive ion channel [Candidatus Neomarinimicrobiota bacterium]MCF7879494.1 mechanosensitive ion channel [Candidatus Neomarinimicrobiota bacterium]
MSIYKPINMKYLTLYIILILFPVFGLTQNPLQSNPLQQVRGQSTNTPADSGSADTSKVVQINRESINQRIDELQKRYKTLFDRDEIAFSKETFSNLWRDVQQAFRGETEVIANVKTAVNQYFSSWNHATNLFLAIIIVIGLLASFFPLKKFLNHRRNRLGESEILAFNTLGHVLEITLRALPTVYIMAGIWLIALVLSLQPNLYYAILRIAIAVIIYKLARWFLEVVFAPEEVHHRLVPCNTKIARYFFHIARSLLQWTLLYIIVLFTLQYLEYHQDFRYFIKFVYRVGAILLFTVLFARRDFTLSLIPKSEVKFYTRLRNFFNKTYYLVYTILLFTGLLSILGYSNLSSFIFSRAFYTAAIILIGILLNHILYDAINWIIPEEKRKSDEDEDSKTARFWDRVHTLSQFLVSALLILFGIVLIAKSWWLLGAQSILGSLRSLFTFTIFQVQDTPITPWSFIKAILIFIVFIYISKYFRRFLNHSVLQKTGLDRGARHAILTITNYIILVIGIVVAMESVGVQLTTLKVFAGALGLGIGFGLQNIANNFASGLIILFERPIKTKDFVHVGDILGTITNISARSTTILTRDNIAIIVPNSDFIEKTVINWSLNDTPTRVHIPISVEYGTDAEKIKEILLDLASEHPRVLKYPRPRVWFKEYGESALDFELLAWINDPQEGINNIQSDINFSIQKRFQEEGVGIPFPQRDIHMKIDDQNAIRFRKLLSGEAVKVKDEVETDNPGGTEEETNGEND